jgi:hypothetical protein
MNPSGKVVLNYGAMCGLSSFAFFIMLNYLGFNALGLASLMGAWIPVVFVCLATAAFRKRFSGGLMSYGQGFRIGFLTASAGAFLFALMIYIYGTAIDPGFIEIYKSGSIGELEKYRTPFMENMYDASIESVGNATMLAIAQDAFFSKTFGGVLISLITAGFYRRQKFFSEPD